MLPTSLLKTLQQSEVRRNPLFRQYFQKVHSSNAQFCFSGLAQSRISVLNKGA